MRNKGTPCGFMSKIEVIENIALGNKNSTAQLNLFEIIILIRLLFNHILFTFLPSLQEKVI